MTTSNSSKTKSKSSLGDTHTHTNYIICLYFMHISTKQFVNWSW